MAEITAAAVKALRNKTQLPMMKCKAALTEAGGDEEKAMEILRKEGEKFLGEKQDRATEEGRIFIHTDIEAGVGAMVELQCESAPVAANEEFVLLGKDLVTQLATGPGAAAPDDLWEQPSPSETDLKLKEQRDALVNRIREVFRLTRLVRIDGPCGGYVHHDGKTGVLLEVEGGDATLAKDICMHIAAMRPTALTVEDLDPEVVAKEREFLSEAARKEGKPENIVEKMVEGRLRNFYAEQVLTEQPFVKDDKQTVGKVAKAGGLKLKKFVHWRLGQE